ncbi:hypothetical protein [Kitasatospora sp. NPDC058190]|uniref:hypothetical protein n=1 Tax=Kitasatospora sp. NPDC058190 TaxID=3346371 RepID=UPI0036DE183E
MAGGPAAPDRLHGLVALDNAHGNTPRPDLTDLIAQTLAPHSGRPVDEIAEVTRTTGRPV